MKHRILTLLLWASLFLLSGTFYLLQAQEEKLFEPHLIDWQHLDALSQDVQGISTAKAYEAVKHLSPQEVVVAVIDSGVDVEHEDLSPQIWTNSDEVPNNGIDDDANGYVDDMHGWNFLGGKDGQNIAYENLESTRIYRKYREQFENVMEANISDNQKETFELYKKAELDYKVRKAKLDEDFELVLQFGLLYEVSDKLIREALGKDTFTLEEVRSVKNQKSQVMEAKAFLSAILADGFDRDTWHQYEQQVSKQVDYHMNLDFNPRDIVGDNPDNPQEQGYGNNDVAGSEPIHGTHVAGIIAATRGNNIGCEGVAKNAKIMCLRAVPNGDERDKDIANAIRYAVDNGAQIINMSFGKSISPREDVVEQAILHAEAKGVLMIHASGNKSLNLNDIRVYPNGSIAGRRASNWIEVAASDRLCNKNLATYFSNYGKTEVDLFAPGMSIFSLAPNDKYDMHDGTSMAAPVVTGVAAMLLSYFPNLSAQQVKDIILESAIRHKRQRVFVPTADENRRKKTKFKQLSATGGIVNAFTAVSLALQKQGSTSTSP